MRMGLREANQRFSQAMKVVKAGKEVVLTERGKPIAVIKPSKPVEDEQAVIERLEAEGMLRSGPNSGSRCRYGGRRSESKENRCRK